MWYDAFPWGLIVKISFLKFVLYCRQSIISKLCNCLVFFHFLLCERSKWYHYVFLDKFHDIFFSSFFDHNLKLCDIICYFFRVLKYTNFSQWEDITNSMILIPYDYFFFHLLKFGFLIHRRKHQLKRLWVGFPLCPDLKMMKLWRLSISLLKPKEKFVKICK